MQTLPEYLESEAVARLFFENGIAMCCQAMFDSILKCSLTCIGHPIFVMKLARKKNVRIIEINTF